MNGGQTLHAKRNDLLRIAAEHGAQNLRVFGSVARNQAGPRSDVDVLTEAAVSPYIRDRVRPDAVPL